MPGPTKKSLTTMVNSEQEVRKLALNVAFWRFAGYVFEQTPPRFFLGSTPDLECRYLRHRNSATHWALAVFYISKTCLHLVAATCSECNMWCQHYLAAPAFRKSSIWRMQYAAAATEPNGRMGARARSSPLAALIVSVFTFM